MPLTTSSLRIDAIEAHHVIEKFDCGEASINTYIQLLCEDIDSDDLARVFTAIDHANRILGFYSISSTNIEFEEAPKSLSGKNYIYPVPAVKIDALAVDLTMQKKGLGARLLIDALQRIYNASVEINVMVVLVETNTERLRAFYLHYGFTPLSKEETKLFLPMGKVTQLFENFHKG